MIPPPAIRLQATAADESATERLGEALARHLGPGDILGLDGPLGAGKTRFVRGLAAGFGLDPGVVASPTFTFCREYGPGPDDDRVIVHVDAYRLSGPAELESIGWDEFAGATDSVTVVEWAARIEAVLPPASLRVHIESGADASTREFTLHGSPDRLRAIAADDAGWVLVDHGD